MSDSPYSSQNFLFSSKGVIAHAVEDSAPPGTYLSLLNVEEIEENGLATRLGTTILSAAEGIVKPLGGSAGVVHSLSRLPGLTGSSWRYAGKGNGLYRISGDAPGEYSKLSDSMSGQPWTAAQFQPVVSSAPLLFIADMNGVQKDNGTNSAPQNAGILQPHYPVAAQAQAPDVIILAPFYNPMLSIYTSSAVATGLQSVSVTDPSVIGLFQSLVIDTGSQQETVLVIATSDTGFTANFTKTHSSGALIQEYGDSTPVSASSTATISNSISTSISTWPKTLEQADYIGLWIYVGDPNAIDSITLKFYTSNGAYFYRTIGQGPLQATLNASTDSTTAAADAVLSSNLGLYTMGAGGVTGLNTSPGWTPILLQLSDFSASGGADFNDSTKNWQNVTTYEVETTTGEGISTTSFPILIQVASFILFGGAGPDSLAGVSYDYMVTLFNINDYTESNPSMTMSDVDPPTLTNRVLPRRQPILLSWENSNSDTQATHWRVYRRGGTLANNYLRIDQIPITTAMGGIENYRDLWSDLEIQQATPISFTNDVPVTSTLPVPVNTTLTADIGTPGSAVNSVQVIIPASMQSISVNQQVNIGNVLDATFETVIVTSISGPRFRAYVQNYHAAGESVSATAAYAQPVNIIAVAFDQGLYAGDPNNPSYLYTSEKSNIQAVSSAAYTQVNVPSDPITAIVQSSGNVFVSTLQRWWTGSPGSQPGQPVTTYPTKADHGVVGKNAWVLRDGVVYYLGTDGLRIFTGGSGDYISEIIEAVWQNTSPTPLPIADPAYFSTVQCSTWNKWVFFSYQALDGNRYRIILDCVNKRYRNDSLDAQSMFLESDTNQLVWGDSQGLVHLDRQLTSTDEANEQGVVVPLPIAFTVQTPYSDSGSPQIQKNYAEFTLDANTNGNPVTVQLVFNDGAFTETLGTITTTSRQRVNLALNNGEGFQAFKVSMILTGSGASRVFLYQAKIRHLPLGETRTSFDSYDLRLGTEESKVLKQIYCETTATADITCNVYYDGTLGYTFTIPTLGGVRNALRVRMPAIQFRIVRFVMTSTSDFILWETSKYEYKPLCAGKSYSTALLMP